MSGSELPLVAQFHLRGKIEGIWIHIFEDKDENIVGNFVAANSSETVRRHDFLSSILLIPDRIYTLTLSSSR